MNNADLPAWTTQDDPYTYPEPVREGLFEPSPYHAHPFRYSERYGFWWTVHQERIRTIIALRSYGNLDRVRPYWAIEHFAQSIGSFRVFSLHQHGEESVKALTCSLKRNGQSILCQMPDQVDEAWLAKKIEINAGLTYGEVRRFILSTDILQRYESGSYPPQGYSLELADG